MYARQGRISLLILFHLLTSCSPSQQTQPNSSKPDDEAIFHFRLGSATIDSYFDFHMTRGLLNRVVQPDNEFDLKTKGKIYGDLDFVSDGKKETYLFFVEPMRAFCTTSKPWRCYHLSESDYYLIINTIRQSLNMVPVSEGAPIFPEFGITVP